MHSTCTKLTTPGVTDHLTRHWTDLNLRIFGVQCIILVDATKPSSLTAFKIESQTILALQLFRFPTANHGVPPWWSVITLGSGLSGQQRSRKGRAQKQIPTGKTSGSSYQQMDSGGKAKKHGGSATLAYVIGFSMIHTCNWQMKRIKNLSPIFFQARLKTGKREQALEDSCEVVLEWKFKHHAMFSAKW